MDVAFLVAPSPHSPCRAASFPSLLSPGTTHSGSDHAGQAVVPTNTPAEEHGVPKEGVSDPSRPQLQPHTPRACLGLSLDTHITSINSKGRSLL